MRTLRVAALAVPAWICAMSAFGQPFNVTVSPNNFSTPVGTTVTIAVNTQSNANTPPAATGVTYALNLTPDFPGGTPQLQTNSPQVSFRTTSPPPNNWTPVTFTVTVAANVVPGVYSGPLVGSYLVSPGNATSFTFLNVFVTVTGGAAPAQDFTVTATPPSIVLTPGTAQQVVFTANGVNGFSGPITIAAPAVSGVVMTPAQTTIAPGQSAPVTIAASATAAAGTTTANFATTAVVSGTSVTHSVPVAITISVPPAANGPTVASLTPPSIVRGALPATLRLTGTNFQPGAIAFADSASIIVQSTRVLTPEFADITVVARPDADLHATYTLLLRNPNGATTPRGVALLVYDQDAIGAPLSVRAAAILSPVEGTLVSGTDSVFPRGLVATTGSGILHGQWRFDGVAYETFDVIAQGGMPVEVRGRLRLPAAEWGDHALTLAVAANPNDLAAGSANVAVSPAITVVSTLETATKLTIFSPRDRTVVGPAPVPFRWSIVPGASGYRIEAGTRDKPALWTIAVSGTAWTPTRDQLRELRGINGGIVLWRVRAVFPGDVLGEPTAQQAIVVVPEKVTRRRSSGMLYAVDPIDRRGSSRLETVAMQQPPGKVETTPADKATVATPQPRISATWTNEVDETTVTLLIDGADVTPLAIVTPTGIVYNALMPLAAGPHTAVLRIGSAETTWSFTVGAGNDYLLSPNGTLSWLHPGNDVAQVQLSGEGDLAGPNQLAAKFTGDIAYKATTDPQSVQQQSRNWVVNGSARQGATSEQVTAGYTTPDLTTGMEFLTTGVARIGAAGQVAGRWGTLAYYEPVTTTVSGLAAATNQNLEIRSFAAATADQKPYQFRAIALELDDPGQPALAGSRTQTVGVAGNYNVTPQFVFTGELAHGSLRPDCSHLSDGAIAAGAVCPTQDRSGNAYRLGFNRTGADTTTLGLVLRRVDANFVNPANRGLTPGGVADRTSADLNLGHTFGRTLFGLTARAQLGGHSHDSTSPPGSQHGATLSASTIFSPKLNLNAIATLSQDRSDASATLAVPHTDRSQQGVSATLSELLGAQTIISETAGIFRAADHVNPLLDQTSSSMNVMAAGTLRPNLTISANAGVTHTSGSSTIGSTDLYMVFVQPSLALPALFLSIAPRAGYNRTTNGLTQFSSSAEQYAMVLQWSPSWWHSALSAQASANWNANESASQLSRTHQSGRTYQASIGARWGGAQAGAPAAPPSIVPGAVPQVPSTVQAGASGARPH